MTETTEHDELVEQMMDIESDPVIAIQWTLVDETLIEAISRVNGFAAIIDERPIYDEESLFRALGEQCGFSWYSMNWNALDDWLCDFSWMPRKRLYVLAFRNSEKLGDGLRAELESCIRFCAAFWSRECHVPLKLLLGQVRDDNSGRRSKPN